MVGSSSSWPFRAADYRVRDNASWCRSAHRGPGITFTALTSSSAGFTAAAQVGQAGADLDAAVWTSADGTNWIQAPASGLAGSSHDLTALAASGAAVTGIDLD